MKFTALRCLPKATLNGKAPRSFSDFDFLRPDGAPYTGNLWSKSAVEKFSACNRKWAWQALAGVREPMGAAAQLGVDLHGEIENWLVNGSPPGDERILDSGVLAVLPAPGSAGLQVESVFAMLVEWTDENGHQHERGFWGFKDAAVGSTVYDLKTKRDLLYAMSPEELSNDLQACLYGLHSLCETGENAATLKWVYLQTQGKAKFQVTEVTLEREDLEAVVLSHLDDVNQMQHYAGQKGSLPVLSVPANPTKCADYGGCFYRDQYCTDLKVGATLTAKVHTSRHEHLRRTARAANQPQQSSSPEGVPVNKPVNPVLARIKADLAKATRQDPAAVNAAVDAVVEAAPVVPVATSKPDVPAAPVAVFTADRVEEQPQPVAQPVKEPPTPAVAAKLAQLKEMLTKSQNILPSEAPITAAVPINKPVMGNVPVANLSSASLLPADNLPAAQPVTGEQPAPTAKRGRGRPSKAELAARLAQQPASQPTVRAPSLAQPYQWPRNAHLALYIDCLPMKGVELHSIDDLIAPVREKVESEAGDGAGMPYRLIEYGKGPALLAAALEESFGENPPMGEFYVMSKTVDAPVLEVLIRHASEVVKGAW